jgi:hypothetical protein
LGWLFCSCANQRCAIRLCQSQNKTDRSSVSDGRCSPPVDPFRAGSRASPKPPARVNGTRFETAEETRRAKSAAQVERRAGRSGSRHSRSKIATRRLVLSVKGTTCAGCCSASLLQTLHGVCGADRRGRAAIWRRCPADTLVAHWSRPSHCGQHRWRVWHGHRSRRCRPEDSRQLCLACLSALVST